jgi:hypothetical protein
MPLNKSWHESLIERGRILMDIGFLGSSKREIKNMNKGKVGILKVRLVPKLIRRLDSVIHTNEWFQFVILI